MGPCCSPAPAHRRSWGSIVARRPWPARCGGGAAECRLRRRVGRPTARARLARMTSTSPTRRSSTSRTTRASWPGSARARPGGLFLVSTPNRGLLDPGISMDQKPFNKFHVREYKRDELEERLGRYFQSVEWFGQSAYARSYVASLDWLGRFCPSLAVRFHQARKCLHWPWESSQCHLPRAWSDGSILPEILIAVCRSPRPGLQRRDGRQ